MKRVLRPPEVRGTNRAAVLGLLQQNDYLSRADVARRSGLSEGAISRIVTGLIKDGLIRENGAENSTGGRPGRRLALEPKRVLFGAEIQNWETRCAICSMTGRIVETRRFRTPASAEETLDKVVEAFLSLRKERTSERLPGIGVCARGIVNSESGVLILGSRPDWRDIPIRKILEPKLQETVTVENNVRAAALAEFTYNPPTTPGRGCFVFVQVDEGVGVGILFDGKLYHGPHMAAGEFGQMVIEHSSGNDRHDRPGCLERLVSNQVVCRRYSELSKGKRLSNLGDSSGRVRRIAELAAAGDEAALQTVAETARYLGLGISNIVWGLDADTIVIGGALTEAWNLLGPAIQGELPDQLDLWGPRNLVVRSSVLGGEASLIGAATLNLGRIFAGKFPLSATGKARA